MPEAHTEVLPHMLSPFHYLPRCFGNDPIRDSWQNEPSLLREIRYRKFRNPPSNS